MSVNSADVCLLSSSVHFPTKRVSDISDSTSLSGLTNSADSCMRTITYVIPR
jgi:hypothetical protein